MFTYHSAFSGFSVKDLLEAKHFYQYTLALIVEDDPMGLLRIMTRGNEAIIAYPKSDHVPANFTILNFVVDDIDTAVDELSAKGVTFLQYNTGYIQTDSKGISRNDSHGHNSPTAMAWFTDPSGNILSLIQKR